MSNMNFARELISCHFQKYKKAEARDLIKLIYQSVNGPEHLVTSLPRAIEMIEREALTCNCEAYADYLPGEYCRLSLGYLQRGLNSTTLAKLFCLSANNKGENSANLDGLISLSREMIQDGLLPFDLESWDREIRSWQEQGYPPTHHSDSFKEAYNPHYRVILKSLLPLIPLLTELDRRLQKGKVKLAIDGGSASGKTTLAALLSSLYDATVIHVDDFFLKKEQRTVQRLSEVGGNMDRERLLKEVLIPLRHSDKITYSKYDCHTHSLITGTEVSCGRLTVIEGAYSLHEDLRPYYDMSVFLNIDKDSQRARILKRNGEKVASRFFSEWIPLEDTYFEDMRVKEFADFML